MKSQEPAGQGWGSLVLTILIWAIALVLLAIAAVIGYVAFSGDLTGGVIGERLGVGEEAGGKRQTFTMLGVAFSGLVLLLNALALMWRSLGQDKIAQAQLDTARTASQAHEHRVFAKAVDQLGHKATSTRLGAMQILSDLAKEEESRRKSIMEILCAHIRGVTVKEEYRQTYGEAPSDEIAIAIKHLGSLCRAEDHESSPEGGGLDFRRAFLRGAEFRGVQLQRAVFGKADLRGIDFVNADLTGAILVGTQMQGAWLGGAGLRGAALREARLTGALVLGACLDGADLSEVNAQGADFTEASLLRANLTRARLQGARFIQARMQGALLAQANLQGSALGEAQLQEAVFTNEELPLSILGEEHANARVQGRTTPSSEGGRVQMQGANDAAQGTQFEEVIRNRSGKGTDLNTVAFSGGMTKEQLVSIEVALKEIRGVSSFPDKELLSGEHGEVLRRLAGHVDQRPSSESPEGVAEGMLTAEEVDAIIREYWEAIEGGQPKGEAAQSDPAAG